MTARLVSVTDAHVAWVAEHMRAEDVAEVWAAMHHTPLEALRDAVVDSTVAQTLLIDDVPALLCGVVPFQAAAGIGVPWMLGTGLVEQAPWEFLRICRQWVTDRRQHWRVMVNYTDARAVKTHRWLQWLGFTLDPAEPYGLDGLPFHRFIMRV